MGIIRRDITNQINCTGEDGAKYTVIEYTEIYDSTEFSGKSDEKGLLYFRLPDGTGVNQIGDSEFEVLSTGLKLKRIEKNG